MKAKWRHEKLTNWTEPSQHINANATTVVQTQPSLQSWLRQQQLPDSSNIGKLLKQLHSPRHLRCCALAGSRAGPLHHRLCLSVRSDSQRTSVQPAVVRRAMWWRGLALTSAFATASHQDKPLLQAAWGGFTPAYNRGFPPYSRGMPPSIKGTPPAATSSSIATYIFFRHASDEAKRKGC